MPQRAPLRKREIAFALAMGVIGAGGAGLVLASLDDEGPRHAPAVQVADRSDAALEDFDEVVSVGPQDVVITYGDGFAVRPEGSPEALAQFEVYTDDETLVIRPKEGVRFNRGLGSVTFFVTMPRIEGVNLAGSGDIRVARVETDEFHGNIAGSGELVIDEMKVDEARFVLGGTGTLVATGTARETHVSIGGRGEVRARGLSSEEASVSIGGSGDVALTVQNEADIAVMGSGTVDIAGPARCSVSQLGRADVRCSVIEND